VTRWLAGAVLVCALALGACADTGGGGGGVDPTPERLDGSSSQEFEADDIARANSASEAVKDYCSGAVSEAQEVGCLSHVDEREIP
jgi:hypothetical protein